MDTRRLEIFLKLLETRSFSKTAAALDLTQPSVSASLKVLEEAVGQKLFERTPRAVKPLPAAETLAPFALNIVETVGRAVWAVGHQLEGAREKLTVGASSVPAMVFLPPALAAYGRQYPNVLIKVKAGQSQGVARKVADGELDLGLVGAPPENEELVKTVFGRDQLALLASRSMADEIGPPPATVEDLSAWPLIMREEGSGTRSALLAALGEGGGDLAGRMNIRAEVEGLGPALALTRASFGAAVISDLLPPVIDLSGLVVMPLPFLRGRRFHLIRRKTRRVSPAVEALLNILNRQKGMKNSPGHGSAGHE